MAERLSRRENYVSNTNLAIYSPIQYKCSKYGKKPVHFLDIFNFPIAISTTITLLSPI